MYYHMYFPALNVIQDKQKTQQLNLLNVPNILLLSLSNPVVKYIYVWMRYIYIYIYIYTYIYRVRQNFIKQNVFNEKLNITKNPFTWHLG